MYATNEQLIASAPAHLIADLTGTEEPDDTAIQRAISDASAEIDGYLGTRYALPLSTVPDVLLRLCCDIGLYRLANLRSLGDLEDLRKRYEDAVRYLELVAKGTVSLGISSGSESEAAGVAGIAFITPNRIMQNLGY